WAESEEGVGSTFYFTTLLSSPKSSQTVSQQLNLAFFKDRTLLIIDDRKVTRTSWIHQSSTWGFQKTLVLNIQKGLDYLKQHRNEVDVVLIDVDRPQAKVNPGLAILQQIRNMPAQKQESDTGSAGLSPPLPTPSLSVPGKPIPCVLVSYHRRNHPDLSYYSSSSPPSKVATHGSPSSVSPISPRFMGPNSPLSGGGSMKDRKFSKGFGSSDNLFSATDSPDPFGSHPHPHAGCMPNTMNSGMLVTKPWNSRKDRSSCFNTSPIIGSSSGTSGNSKSGADGAGTFPKCSSPTSPHHPILHGGLTAATHPLPSFDLQDQEDASVGHLIKPVKQSKLLPMFHGLMTGSWPLAYSAMPDNDVRSDQRKKQMETLECLLVDDNPVNQKVISKMLSRIGIVPELAANGLEAVKKCQARAEAVAAAAAAAATAAEGGGDGSSLTSTTTAGGGGGGGAMKPKKVKQYDIVFMDIWMPIMSGHEATKEIRATVPGVTATSPLIVAMTACVMPGDQQKCIDSGMNRYLSKPIRKEELSKTVEDWLDERAKAEEELKLLNQRKLIQKKKREILQKRSLAVLTTGVDEFGQQVEAGLPTVTVVNIEDDDEDDDEDEDDSGSDQLGQSDEGLGGEREEELVDSNDGKVFPCGVHANNINDEIQLHSLENNRIAAARQKRRHQRTRMSTDPMLMSDSEGVLGCCDGGGGGLKIISVGEGEVRAATRVRKQSGSRNRGGSVSILDPLTGSVVQGNRTSGGDEYEDDEFEDDESDMDVDDDPQQTRTVFAEGTSVERPLSPTTIDSLHTASTHNTHTADGASSRRSSLLPNFSNLRTIRGI
ncbi:hypothetical protein EC957_002876, partial [Mortierella hygrophila]